MYDFDITLMALSQPSSFASAKLMQLFDYFSGIGLNCKVSTHPSELAKIRPEKRRPVIILDGTDNSEYDVYALAARLRSQHLYLVVLLVDNGHDPKAARHAPGAQLCLPIRTSPEELAESIITALHGAGQPPRLKPDTQLDPRHSAAAAEAPSVARFQERDAWVLEERGWKLVAPTGVAVMLTGAERKLMHQFFKSPAAAILHQDFDDSHDAAGVPRSGSLTVAVSRLRRKFRAAGVSLPIQSNRGEGYQFTGRCNTTHQTFDTWH